MSKLRVNARKQSTRRKPAFTKAETIGIVLGVISAASGLAQAAADPNVRIMIHHVAKALGIGFQKSVTQLGEDMTARGLPEEQVVVEIYMRLPYILDAIKELGHESALTSMEHIQRHGTETRDAALRRLQEIAIERLRANEDLKGAVIAVLEQHALAPEITAAK
ncbi:hypothetical protein WT34_24255 [Burkholderia stagnalis]|uniref:hypothetical protein n=1 Tax=Burkholderia stagnalis TaxID=1503054 RepID=UPI00075247E4|nr:hypothetical protein [Burkholderia stagnalis]KVX69093.1 hypothetical protein WT34_24255 [Burkholderia stagnalis]